MVAHGCCISTAWAEIARLRIAAETTKDYAILTVDEAGLITTWNLGARRIFGYEEKEVIVSQGRFGPYVKWGDAFVSIPRTEDPLQVDISRAIELIEEKKA